MQQVIISVLVTILFVAPVVFLLTKYVEYHHSDRLEAAISSLGKKRKSSGLGSGHYYSVYLRYNRSGEMRIHRGIASLRRLRFLRSQRALLTLMLPDRTTLEASIDDIGLLSGTWNSGSGDKKYHGVFQFKQHRSRPILYGKWLGFNHDDRIRCGVWVLMRMNVKVSEDSIKNIVQELSDFNDNKIDFPASVQSFEDQIRATIKEEKAGDLSMSLNDVKFDSQQLEKLASDRPTGPSVSV